MKALVDAIILLALMSVLAFFVHQHTQVDARPAMPAADGTAASRPSAMLDRPLTKFDMMFKESELARP
jgi:hypothetical protein